jgi:hypothetical protein
MIGTMLSRPAPRRIAFSVLVACGLALAGCGGSQEIMTCPNATIAPELDVQPQFAAGAPLDPANVISAGKLLSVNRGCEREKGGIAVNLTIVFSAARARPNIQQTQISYFVAVVDSSNTILNEGHFTLPVSFTQDFRTLTEKITVHLPLAHISNGDSYGAVVGFQLTPEQLDFNRRQNPR